MAQGMFLFALALSHLAVQGMLPAGADRKPSGDPEAKYHRAIAKLIENFDQDGDAELSPVELARAIAQDEPILRPPSKLRRQIRLLVQQLKRPRKRKRKNSRYATGVLFIPRTIDPLTQALLSIRYVLQQNRQVVAMALRQRNEAIRQALASMPLPRRNPSLLEVAHALVVRFDRDRTGGLNDAELGYAVPVVWQLRLRAELVQRLLSSHR